MKEMTNMEKNQIEKELKKQLDKKHKTEENSFDTFLQRNFELGKSMTLPVQGIGSAR